MRTHARREGPAPTMELRSGRSAAASGAAGITAGGSALDRIAQRANAGPHAASLAGLQSVVAQRAAAAGGAVAQRVLRVNGKNYRKEVEIRKLAPRSATTGQVDELVRMGALDEQFDFDDWYDAVKSLPQQFEDIDEEEDTQWSTGENRLANIDNVIRYWAKRAGGRDSSGHGEGKKISSGNSKDRHQQGQKRKVQHRAGKVGSLQSALALFVEAGGSAVDLGANTVKSLNQSGVSWRAVMDDAERDLDDL